MSTKNNKKGTELVISAENTAPDLINMLKSELSQLKKTVETPFKVSGAINIGGQSVNISNEQNIENLIIVMGAVERLEESYTKAATGVLASSLGDTVPLFKVNGYTVEAIAHDINLKITIISETTRRKELEELVAEAQGFMTKEDQYKMFLQKMASKLGKA